MDIPRAARFQAALKTVSRNILVISWPCSLAIFMEILIFIKTYCTEEDNMRFMPKRIYEPSAPEDGFRVLVDRLWPRGVSKANAHLNLWLKDIAPSTELRKWFNHDPAKWEGFQDKYRQELDANPGPLAELRQTVGAADTVTLLYGARDAEHNEAVVLAEYLRNHI